MSRQNNESIGKLWSHNLGYVATRSLQILIIGILVAIVLKMVLTVNLVLLPILLALILGSSLWPLVRQLRPKVGALGAALIALLGCVTLLSAVSYILFLTIKMQWGELSAKAGEGITKLQDLFFSVAGNIDPKQVESVTNSLKEGLGSFGGQIGSTAVTGISAAGSFAAGFALTLVILFFFLKDGDSIWRFFASWLPERNKVRIQKSGVQAVLTLGDYIRGTSIVAAVDAVGIGIGLVILGIPLAIPLSIIVFLGGFIPMVGATLAGVLAALVALVANGPVAAVIVIGIVILVNQIEGNLLQPIVMSKTLSLHGLVILVVLTIGTVLGGIVGAILAVPLTATAWSIVKIWTDRQNPEDVTRLRSVMAQERKSIVRMNARTRR